MPEPFASPVPDPGVRPADPAFAALADLTGLGVLLVGEDGTVAYGSRAAWNALGSNGAAALRAAWPRLLEQYDPDRGVTRGVVEAGSAACARALRIEVRAPAGGTSHYLVLVEASDGDAVTRLRLASQALTNAYLAAALLHEINAPLNNVKLTLALCDASLARAAGGAMPVELRARLARYFKVVGDETSRLAGLLEELRRMSGAALETYETFDLAGLGADIVRLMRHEATIRRVRLALQPAGEPLPVRADRRALLLALLGIVIHLVEQTSPEGVVLLSSMRLPDGNACVRIESSAVERTAATRQALDQGAATACPQYIPLLAARAQVEALHGCVRLTEDDGGLRFAVQVPMAA
jgi:signal transduction histidine kinase